MITIQQAVTQILERDIDAKEALLRGFMNYSAYADSIADQVKSIAKKDTTKESIIMALSRLAKSNNLTTFPKNIHIKNLTSKAPLTEIVFEKNSHNLKKLQSFFSKSFQAPEDFLTLSYSTHEITITCSSRLTPLIEKHFESEPIMKKDGLASLALSINTAYYDQPGITYGLNKRIAARGIVLAETISSYTEIIFTFEKKYLADMVDVFS